SYVPDGTVWIGGTPSSLFASLDAKYATEVWQREFARALQTWSAYAPLNFHQVTDDGSTSGAPGLVQGDSRFGDIRLGAQPLGSLANGAYPYSTVTTGGDITLSTSYDFKIGANYDLYSTLLHEAGHALGLQHSVAGTVMYSTIMGVYTGLTADDIAGIQAKYGVRQADAYDAGGGNNSLASATPLAPTLGTSTVAADLTSVADVDYFRITVPAGGDGTLTV